MRAGVVIGIDIVLHDTLQMLFVQNEQFVQTRFTDALYPAFSVSVGIGCVNRRANDLDVF